MQGGAYAAKVIRARLEGKTSASAISLFQQKAEMAVIGPRGGGGEYFWGTTFSGLLAWLMWLFIHLIYIVEFQSRIMVFRAVGIRISDVSAAARGFDHRGSGHGFGRPGRYHGQPQRVKPESLRSSY